MARFKFIGPAYTSRSIEVDCQECINLFTENIERNAGSISASSEERYALYGTPGRQLFCTLGDSPVRGVCASNEAIDLTDAGSAPGWYAVAGTTLYKIVASGTSPTDATGTATVIGTVAAGDVPGLPALPVQIQPVGNRKLIVRSNGGLYLADATALTVTAITLPDPMTYCTSFTVMDQYCIISGANASGNLQQFWISNVGDFTIFDPLDFATKEGNPDPILAVFSAYEQLFLFGPQTMEMWYDTGALNFPFQRMQGGGLLETGLALGRPEAICKMDNTIAWIGSDSRGYMVAWELRGNTPVRISNHAVENEWLQYNSAGVICYPYQEGGHFFFVVSFALNNVTWVYDSTTNHWHKRGQWDGSQYLCDIARYHGYNTPLHVVGDYRNGNLYLQSVSFYSDPGQNIRRLRRAPHISDEKKRLRHARLHLDMQTGAVPGTGAGSNPVMVLRFSDNGGQTWSNEKLANAGSVGQYAKRVIWRQLGSARDRVYEISTDEPIPIAFIDCYLDLVGSTERSG